MELKWREKGGKGASVEACATELARVRAVVCAGCVAAAVRARGEAGGADGGGFGGVCKVCVLGAHFRIVESKGHVGLAR